MHYLKQLGLLPVLVSVLLFTNSAIAQTAEAVYGTNCAGCHDNGILDAPAPTPANRANWLNRIDEYGDTNGLGGLRDQVINTGVTNMGTCTDQGVPNDLVCEVIIDYMLDQAGISTDVEDLNLFSLQLEGIDLAFNPSTTTYNLRVENDVENTTLTTAVNNARAFINGLTANGRDILGTRTFGRYINDIRIPLNVNENTIQVVVVDENYLDIPLDPFDPNPPPRRIYTVSIERASEASEPASNNASVSVRVFLEGSLNDP